MPKYNDGGRYQLGSVLMHDKAQLPSLANEYKPWPMPLVHLLTHRYMVESMCLQPMAILFERSVKGVWTKLETVAIARDKNGKGNSTDIYVEPLDFEPIRTGQEFNARDKYIIKLATDETGIDYGRSFRPEYIAPILRRDVDEVREFMQEFKAKPRGFNLGGSDEPPRKPFDPTGPSEQTIVEIRVAVRVHIELEYVFKNVSRDSI